MFPIADDNPVQRSPIVTWALIVACVLVFLWQLSLGRLGDQMIFALGVIPATLFGYAQLPADIALIPPWATIFTSMAAAFHRVTARLQHLGCQGLQLAQEHARPEQEDSAVPIMCAALHVISSRPLVRFLDESLNRVAGRLGAAAFDAPPRFDVAVPGMGTVWPDPEGYE